MNKSFTKIYTIILALLLSLNLYGVDDGNRKTILQIEKLLTEYKNNYKTSTYDTLTSICEKAYILSVEIKNPYYIITTSAYLGQMYSVKEDYIKAYPYLHEAYTEFNSNRDILKLDYNFTPIYMVYNGLALYYINYQLDYKTGVKYLIEGIQIAKEYSHKNDYAVMGSNLINTYYLRNDPAGLEYAMDIYEHSQKVDNRFVEYVGVYGLSMMYYVDGKYQEALKYIEKIINDRELSESTYYGNNKKVIFATYGKILNKSARYTEASEAFLKSMEMINSYDMSTQAYVYISYAEFLLERNRFNSAIELLKKAEMNIVKGEENIFTYQIYELLSNAYVEVGDSVASLEYYRKFHEEYSRIFDVKNERIINELTLKYQSSIHDAEIQEYNILMMKRRRQILILVFVSVMVLSFAFLVSILYRSKNKLFIKIAKQYKVAIKMEEELKQIIDQQQSLIEANIPKQKYVNSSLDENKDRELFHALESLMKKDKVFKEHSLTRDRVAELLNTNRTYLTQVINENTSKTFNQYINFFRVEESLRLLSSGNTDYPMKAVCYDSGFSSRTTFNNTFHDQVGMTPTKYREKIISLS